MDVALNGRQRRPASSKVRCPKCRSESLWLTENVWCTTSWEVKGGRLDLQEGFHEPGGVDSIEAKCSKCSHTWKLRGAMQIIDVTVEDDEGVR